MFPVSSKLGIALYCFVALRLWSDNLHVCLKLFLAQEGKDYIFVISTELDFSTKLSIV